MTVSYLADTALGVMPLTYPFAARALKIPVPIAAMSAKAALNLSCEPAKVMRVIIALEGVNLRYGVKLTEMARTVWDIRLSVGQGRSVTMYRRVQGLPALG